VSSLLSQGSDDEVLVFENGSTDGSADLLQSLASRESRVKAFFSATNLGTTASRNIALRETRGRYLGIVDSDVETPAGTVDRLIAQLDADATCGIAVPRLLYPDGRLQLSTDVFPTLARKFQRYFGLRSLERDWAATGGPALAVPVDYAISAFWVMRRDLPGRIGYLDDRIFYSPEDVDYCIRVWQDGLRVIYDPSATAIHHAQEISRKFPLRRATLSHIKGLFYLFRKHAYGVLHSRPRGVPRPAVMDDATRLTSCI